MMQMDTPELAAEAAVTFASVDECRAWLERLPLLNTAVSHGALTARLELLNAAHVPVGDRLAMLEILRPAVVAVQAEQAKKCANKPLPLSPQRREILEGVSKLWDALALGYQKTLAAASALGHDTDTLARACHRALDCAWRAVLDHARAYVQTRATDLRKLHRMYATAESYGFAALAVTDPLSRSGRSQTCARTYVRALLLDAASPRERPPEQLDLLAHWLDRWAPKVMVKRESPRGAQLAPLMVDLASDAGARRRCEPGKGVRYLDVTLLAKSLAKRIHGARQGQGLEQLELEGTLEARDAEQVLVSLYRHWCESEPRRAHQRHEVRQPALVCAGLEAVHFGLGGTGATSGDGTVPGNARRVQASLARAAIAAETWLLRDESIAGLGLVRPRDDTRAAPVTHGQLVLVHGDGGRKGMVAAVQWLQESGEGDMHVGARILPGVPAPVTVRNGDGSRALGIALSALPALNEPATLVLPAGWFRPGRTLEVREEGLQVVRLAQLVERGTDYERVSFERMR